MTLRITNLVEREEVTFIVDGNPVKAYAGESVAAALFVIGIRTLRYSPKRNQPRGMFCLMGVCQECWVRVDGQRRLACQEPVQNGLVIYTGAAL